MTMMTTADAIVVGGGAVGASAFFHLCSMGLGRIVLCERREIGAGASGASGAFIQMHFCRNEAETRLTQESLPYFQRWDQMVGSGTCGYEAAGYLRLEPEERVDILRDRVSMLQSLGVNTREIAADDAKGLALYLRTDDVAAVAYESESGFADGQRTIEGFLAAGQNRGGVVLPDVAVTDVFTSIDRARGVETTSGRIEAPVVVLAAGAWSAPLLQSLGLTLPVTISLTQWIGFEWADGAPRPMMTIGDGVLGSYFRHWGDRQHQVLIGLGGMARRYIGDPDDKPGVPEVTINEARRRLVVRLAGSPDLRYAGTGAGPITLTPDDLPIIDRHPQIEGLAFFTGDGGACFKTAPAIGRALADLAVSGESKQIATKAFRHDRFTELGHTEVAP